MESARNVQISSVIVARPTTTVSNVSYRISSTWEDVLNVVPPTTIKLPMSILVWKNVSMPHLNRHPTIHKTIHRITLKTPLNNQLYKRFQSQMEEISSQSHSLLLLHSLESLPSCQNSKILLHSSVEYCILFGVLLNGDLLQLCFGSFINLMAGIMSSFIFLQLHLRCFMWSTSWHFWFRTLIFSKMLVSINGSVWDQTGVFITYWVLGHFWPHINSRISCFLKCSTSSF